MSELIRKVSLVFNKIYIFLFPIEKIKRKYKKKRKASIYGEYPTIKILLEDLDDVFSSFKKLSKKRNAETQKIIKAYGPHVSCGSFEYEAENDGLYSNKLEGFKAYGLPSFLICYNREKDKDNIQYFFTATKTKRANFGQKGKGKIYYDVGLTLVDDRWTGEKFFDIGYCVEVDKINGDVVALPYKQTKITQLRFHDPKSKGASYHSIPAKIWQYPDFDSDDNNNFTQTEIKKRLAQRFCISWGMTMKRETGINIYVKKAGYRATFNVPHNDWKYFFKDRIKAKTMNGNTKPIYHAVASHFREINSGFTTVKTHYRGLRHFIWSGYEIKIVMQGKHGASQAGLGLECIDYEDTEALKDGIDITSAAGKLNKRFEGV